MMREPKTEPIPAPDPATPTVAAPAPMNLAAESMSFLTEVVVKALLAYEENYISSLKKPSQLKDNIFTWLAHIADTAGLWNWAMTFLEQVRRATGYIL